MYMLLNTYPYTNVVLYYNYVYIKDKLDICETCTLRVK